jgi:Tol biopolymer transport system component/predicted Ser/Thr protein kinase
MSLQQSIAHYRITAKLGEGGMGAVYRATDTKLNRDVAIKVLPDAFANDADRLARFTREAQVLAALNHPNIAAIYGVEEKALVMEFVPGQTLEERIAVGPIAIEEALGIARQIAEALDAAHEKGVVHRDLKPANVKVTPEGMVKVLDFGLAKASDPAGSTSTADSPTLTIRATQAGIIMGTAGYMAPEQAAGKTVDRRADIWSFGVVLYELLTGKTLFTGETISHKLASVLKDRIDFDTLQVPAPIRGLLERCLDRDPRSRLRDIGEARVAIDRYMADPSASAPSAMAMSRARRTAVLPWALAVIGLAATVVLAFLHPLPSADVLPVRFTVPLPGKFGVNSFDLAALSPDGRNLAFTAAMNAGRTMLLVRSMDSLEARLIPGTEGAIIPFWSSDSRSIGFSATGKTKRLGLDGSAAVTLADGVSLGAAWNRDGVILLGRVAGPLEQVQESGGVSRSIFKLDAARQETGQGWPQFLPDGKHFLYLSRNSGSGQSGIYLGTMGSTQTRRLLDADVRGWYSPPGYLLYLRQETLMAQAFDASKLELGGNPFPVAEGVGRTPDYGGGLFATSDTGTLVYRAGSSPDAILAVFDRGGRKVGTIGTPGNYTQLTLSPDGKRLAIDRRDAKATNFDLWMLELASGVSSRITSDSGNERDAVFSANGKQLVFSSDRTGQKLLYRKTIGDGPEELLYKATEQNIPEAWLKDGSVLFGNQGGKKYFLLPPGGGEPKPLYQTEFTVDEPAISPDGKWVAYGSNESGRWEIHTARFPEWNDRRQISPSSGMQPHWRQDGRQIVYLASDGRLMSVDVKPGAELETGQAVALFDSGLRPNPTIEQFCMSPDGTKLYVPIPVEENEKPMTVVLNWWPRPHK